MFSNSDCLRVVTAVIFIVKTRDVLWNYSFLIQGIFSNSGLKVICCVLGFFLPREFFFGNTSSNNGPFLLLE